MGICSLFDASAGWIKANTIGRVNPEFAKTFGHHVLVTFKKDDIPIHDEKGDFLFHTKAVMHLPVRDNRGKIEDAKRVSVFISVKRANSDV